jgi:dihydropteroate synthase
MGILNITPDSFYNGGSFQALDLACKQLDKMLIEGASIIDIGAQSTRPNATFLSASEELNRLIPIFTSLRKKYPDTIFSIDTFHSEVAQTCIDEGADMINDISAGNIDSNMMEVIGKKKVPFIMMHMKGTPQNMIEHNIYENMTQEILDYFKEKIALARSFGIEDLIIDPGFGFAKNIEQNFKLLSEAEIFSSLELPVLFGLSRKSMIYKTLNIQAAEALNGTTVLNTIALQKGASLLRVHDVKEAMEAIRLYSKMK